MLAFRDLEPLARKQMLGVAFGHRRIAAMAVEHAVHLRARGEAFEDFANDRGGVHRRLLQHDWAEARAIRRISSSLPSFVTPPRQPPLRSGGSRAAARGRSFTLDAPAGHAAAIL